SQSVPVTTPTCHRSHASPITDEVPFASSTQVCLGRSVVGPRLRYTVPRSRSLGARPLPRVQRTTPTLGTAPLHSMPTSVVQPPAHRTLPQATELPHLAAADIWNSPAPL